MKTSNISYLRKHLSEVISCVKEGETVLVLDRNKPVATLIPYSSSRHALPQRIQELQRQGLLHHDASNPPMKKVKPLRLKSPVDMVNYILEERENS